MVRKTVFRLIVLVLVAVLWLPVGRVSAEEASVGVSKEAMFAALEPQIRAFAKSIDQKNADTEAAADLAVHGMTGRGKTLKMGTKDPLTAALVNSELVQQGFSEGLAVVFWNMQRLNLDSVAGARLQFVWDGSKDQYFAYILKNWGNKVEDKDWMVVRGTNSGSRNTYDSSLEWMVGSVYVDLQIRCVADQGDARTYRLNVVFRDKFDFSTASTSGFKKLMSGLGMLLFKEFEWECSFSLDVTVPYSYDHCAHGLNAYRWVYDKENKKLVSDSTGSFRQNNAALRTVTSESGNGHHYFELDQTVLLLHDAPWVVEYDAVNPRMLELTPVEYTVTKTKPLIWQYGGTSLFVSAKLDSEEQDPYEQVDSHYVYGCLGPKLEPLFSYDKKKCYTYRLENVPGQDGKNVIYLTVTDTETGVVEIDRLAMDDFYRIVGWKSAGALLDTESDLFAGRDILINFIGSSLDPLQVDSLELRIWEAGERSAAGDFWVEETVEATCTEKGSVVKTCSRCGFAAEPELIEALGHDWVEADCLNAKTCKTCGAADGKALGHDFGEWEIVVPAECEKEGEKVRVCHCGVEEREIVPGLSHAYEKGSCVLCGELDPECLMGDVDFDGKLSYNDALKVLRYSIGLESLENPAVADITGDGNVNYEDALAILRTSIGL